MLISLDFTSNIFEDFNMKSRVCFWVSILLSCNIFILPAIVNAQPINKPHLEKKFLGKILNPTHRHYIALKDVNVRNAPLTKAAKVTVIRKGTRIIAAGKAKGTKWIAIKKDGKNLGFVYNSALVVVLNGELNSDLTGKLQFSSQPNCSYTLKFDGKHEVKGHLQITSDYWISFTCKIKGEDVKFIGKMFITELPYRDRKKNIFQVNLDLPTVTDSEGEVMSVTSLYNMSKNILMFEDVTVPSMANKLSSTSKMVKTVPEILKTAVELAYRIWGPLVWKYLASQD